MDSLSIVEDEVALEGLDGITIPTLWIRLENRQPAFPLKLDDSTKGFIWKCLVNNTDLRLYELPQEREDVELFDRFKAIDPETGIETGEKFSDDCRDIYPVHIIPENKNGIQGSCSFFKERKDVTKQIRSKSLTPIISLEEALKRYGRKLVIVASQPLRFRTLIGAERDPDLKLSSDSYCVLERVGRARWQGELQRDLHGGLFNADARKFHYFRKSLVKHDLITMQSYVKRLKTGQQQHSILLLLKRFHVNRRTKYDILMECVSNFLQQSPEQFATVDMLKEYLNLNENSFKRLFNYLRSGKVIEFCQYPLEDLDPNAGPCTNKNGTFNHAKAHSANLYFFLFFVFSFFLFISVLSSGAKGCSQRDISSRMNIGHLESRMVWRKLQRDGVIKVRSLQYSVCFVRVVLFSCIIFFFFFFLPDQTPVEEDRQSKSTPASSVPQSDAGNAAENTANNKIFVVVDNVFQSQVNRMSHFQWFVSSFGSGKLKLAVLALLPFLQRSHETYRLLKRKNLIVEAVRNSKIIEGFFPLQKLINDEEKQDGVSTKCCKKTILRLVHTLFREGLLKLYTTTVIQDGISKKVDIIVHPSIQPDDERVKQLIEQIRFKISSSASAMTPSLKCLSSTCLNAPLRLVVVRGLGKSLGYQPKMQRLHVIHSFLWYLIYEHPLRNGSAGTNSASEAPAEPNASSSDVRLQDGEAQPDLKETEIYVDEDSWKRFVPPVRVRKDFTSGWAMVCDILLCLPLSVFVQFTQINYMVDGLEEYVSDLVKQHYLVRSLPAQTKRQLLYKRKYIHMFHENLQRLAYMGLLQFAPIEKFKEKDQVCVYLKRNVTIVDTTSCEPHYWLVTEPPDKPFETRHYTFNSTEDVERYWFDLMCVCLNTPLGTQIHNHRSMSFNIIWKIIMGSWEVCDDGSIPGDRKGAAGLDSEFFAHLKRNWLWTNHLLACKTVLNQQKYMLAAGEVVGMEPASRNQQLVGGKGQRRKRSKKEVVKAPRKRRKGAEAPKKRTPAHDEADHKALKMMTKQRVQWSVQEDSVIMLCSVASHLLNSKLKRAFVPYCVVRDQLHAEFEISVDKTSLAVGRRTRYILKNPQTRLNYRICLAEVYQDKTLMSQLEDNKPADPDKPEVCLCVCVCVCVCFRLTVDSLTRDSNVSTRFVSGLCQSLLGVHDIHAIVLHNLIQSTLAMTNSQMKTSRSFQTFHTYSRYDQELLCQVFLSSRKRRLLNRRRVGQYFSPKKNRGLPILPMSFQLSQTYYRRFLWRFPQSLCTDSFCFLRTRASEDPPDVSDMLRFSLNSPGGACVASLSLMSLGLLSVFVSIPKQIVVVDSNLVDNDVAKSMAALEEEDDDDDEDGNEECEGKKRLQVTSHQASHTNYLLMRGYCSPGIVKLRNLSTNDNIVVESCIVRLKLRDTPAHHRLLPASAPPLNLTKCGPSLLPSILTSSVRSPASPPPSAEECQRLFIQERGYTAQDVDAWARLRRSLDEAGEKGVDARDLRRAHAQLQEPQSGRTRSLLFFLLQDLQESLQVVRVGSVSVRWVLMQHADPWLLSVNCKQLPQSHLTSERRPFPKSRYNIPFMRKRCSRELRGEAEEPPAKKPAVDTEKVSDGEKTKGSPADVTEIPDEKERQQETAEGGGELQSLDEEGKVQTLSLTSERPVILFIFSYFSFLHSFSTPHRESVSFISRPWRFIDGKLNRPVCKGILEAILFHIMSRPGLAQQALLDHYKDVLQPVAVLDLVQALLELGCVTKRTLAKAPKPSLFARSARQTKSEATFEEADTVFYEPTVSCCLRLCQVLPNERHWNDFAP
uniref:Ral transcription factor IIIC subunit 1 n=1 Tax=Kryptolebias marmoratus TaxID=37003 RepID=A0A3Q3AAB1_KRYMA